MDLTDGQITVLEAFRTVGSMEDVVAAAYVHHIADMSSSGVRSRRAELVSKGALEVVGTKVMRSGRKAAVHGITKAGRQALRKNRVKVTA